MKARSKMLLDENVKYVGLKLQSREEVKCRMSNRGADLSVGRLSVKLLAPGSDLSTPLILV